MTRLEMVQQGGDRLQVSTWRGDADVALLTPVPGKLSHRETIDRALVRAQTYGCEMAMTSALLPTEREPFLAAGFEVREHLHLLRHHLDVMPERPSNRIRRGWWRDYSRVLSIDHQAFDAFWRFDRSALVDARSATPSSQFRIAESTGVAGYAITGRAGSTCYLQRLAVAPERQRAGLGSDLVADALWWAASHRCDSVLVNTQFTNAAALELYQRVGFVAEPEGLAVLERRCETPGA